MIPNPRRRLAAVKLSAIAAAATLGLVATSPARAATYTYCNPCALSAPGSTATALNAYYISLSYGHALSGGGVCTGAYGYASLICGSPESEHEYHRLYSLRGEIEDWYTYFENFNAHVDY